MHQVVTNLLGNALKFTPAGGTVTIRTGQDGPGAVLEVADTGIGIPADELPRVFDRFWRGQASRARGRASPSPCPAPERLHIAAMATAHRLHRRRLCLSHESKLRIHLQDDC